MFKKLIAVAFGVSFAVPLATSNAPNRKAQAV